MKKTLFKTAFICLGITLLCGLYSFKTPDGVKSQQNYRTASIVYDTIITPDGDESECIKKEVVVEGDKDGCTCTLYVSYDSSQDWSLRLKKSIKQKDVVAYYSYKKYGLDGKETENSGKIISVRIKSDVEEITIDQGQYRVPFDCNDSYLTVCEPGYLRACFYVDPNSNK